MTPAVGGATVTRLREVDPLQPDAESIAVALERMAASVRAGDVAVDAVLVVMSLADGGTATHHFGGFADWCTVVGLLEFAKAEVMLGSGYA